MSSNLPEVPTISIADFVSKSPSELDLEVIAGEESLKSKFPIINLKYGKSKLPFEFDEDQFEILGTNETQEPLSDVEIGEKLETPMDPRSDQKFGFSLFGSLSLAVARGLTENRTIDSFGCCFLRARRRKARAQREADCRRPQ